MTKNKKNITLLISIYSWDWKYDYDTRTSAFINPIKEDVFEVQIRSIEDMTILSLRLGWKVKFKKPTDKNWYTYRAMTKRLFNKEINESHGNLEPVFSSVIDLMKVKEERRKAKEERNRGTGFNRDYIKWEL